MISNLVRGEVSTFQLDGDFSKTISRTFKNTRDGLHALLGYYRRRDYMQSIINIYSTDSFQKPYIKSLFFLWGNFISSCT